MISHASAANTAEMYARKLQAANVLAALSRMSLMGEMSSDENAAFDQGLQLLDSLIEGEQLFSGERVTRQLVAEGMAFLVAARALDFEQENRLTDCGVFLKGTRSTLNAIKIDQPVSREDREKLEDFLTKFARTLQSDINMIRSRRHVIPT